MKKNVLQAMCNRIVSKALVVALVFLFLVIPANAQSTHTTDRNANWTFSLSELLRVIQLYQLGGLHCDPASEDGFNPGAGDQTCTPHASDYNQQDWNISFDELLRMIQLYNTLAYYECPEVGEDGFCPETPGMVYVPAGNFDMGDPFNEGGIEELPVHTVYLDAYHIGRFEVTHQEYVEVLNWAYGQGLFQHDVDDTEVTAYGKVLTLTTLFYYPGFAFIEFVGGVFTVANNVSRDWEELYYPMDDHPVMNVTWYGAAAYCNWRSGRPQPCI